MVKITGILLLLVLCGCTSTPKIEIKEVYKPILYCPAPPSIKKPLLALNTIKDSDSAGDVVVKYKASIRALIDYSESLELIIENYLILSKQE